MRAFFARMAMHLTQNLREDSSMNTDTMRVLADEELDYIVGGLSGTNLSGSVTVGTAEISFQDIGVNSSSDGTSVDLGGPMLRLVLGCPSPRTAM
jgi:hypothetical protein